MDNGLSIDELTTGVSGSGLVSYLGEIQAEVLSKIEEEIGNVDDIKTALNNGWAGKSKDDFFKQFDDERQEILTHMRYEYNDLALRLSELEKHYIAQDENMIE